MSAGRGTRRLGGVAAIRTGDKKIDRAFDDATAKLNTVIRSPFAQTVALEVTLASGLNKIGHGLGRPVAQFLHTALPTTGVFVANAQAENPSPERQVWVRMTGVAELKVTLFLLPRSS